MMVLPDSCVYQYHVPLLIVGYHPDREPQKHYSRHLLPANLRSIAVTGRLRHPHGHALVPIVAPVRVDEFLIILVKLFEGLPCALPAWRNIRPRSSYGFLGSKQHLAAYPRHLTL